MIWQDSRTPVDAARGEHLLLGSGHAWRFAVDELDAAGRAPRVAAARMQHVDPGILLDRQHQPLSLPRLRRARILRRSVSASVAVSPRVQRPACARRRLRSRSICSMPRARPCCDDHTEVVFGLRRAIYSTACVAAAVCAGRAVAHCPRMQDIRIALRALVRRPGIHAHRARHAGARHRRQRRHLQRRRCGAAAAAAVRRSRAAGHAVGVQRRGPAAASGSIACRRRPGTSPTSSRATRRSRISRRCAPSA